MSIPKIDYFEFANGIPKHVKSQVRPLFDFYIGAPPDTERTAIVKRPRVGVDYAKH